MSTVVLASPIAKIFIPSWAKRCARDPELITSPDVSFDIMIPTSTGSLGPFPFMVPIDLNKLPALRRFEKEDSGTPRFRIIMEWLCSQYSEDAAHHETDQFGIVEAKGTGADLQALAMQKIMLEQRLKKEQTKQDGKAAIIQELQSRIIDLEESIDKSANDVQRLATELANKRVMRHVRKIWTRMKKEWLRLEESKQEKLTPSYTEQCVMIILEKEIKAQNDERSSIQERVRRLSESLGVQGM